MNIGLIGYGYWGKKVYKTLSSIISKNNIFVSDLYIRNLPSTLNKKSLNEILLDRSINHVFIITPEETHFEIAKKCLDHQKNIFVEKPLCLKENEAKLLHKVAKRNGLKIYVDYIFLFDPYVKKIKELIESNFLGKIERIESIRHSININKPNISVSEDLATHDIYLGKYFYNKKISYTSTFEEFGLSNKSSQALVTFSFGKQVLSANYSWIQPTPKRVMTFFGKKLTIVWDKDEKKLKIYRNQKLVEKIEIEDNLSPLLLSIKEFIYGKSQKTYVHDVMILEKLRSK